VRGRTTSPAIRGGLAAISVVAAFGCGPGPITAARIETAIATTFANLVRVQIARLGLPPVPAASSAATASCRKLTAARSAGSGEWLCTVVWEVIDRQPVRETYDLFVATDGCYTATVEGENLGGSTVKATDGTEVRNLLYTFEGCFDTT
jgi:hypothetical protein